MNTGYIKLHRKMTSWEWYDDANTFRLFIHLLLKANHKDKKWHGIDVKRGSFITGYDKLTSELGLSKQQIRTSMNKLKSTHEVTHQPTHRYSVVTIVNYDSYQGSDNPSTHQAIPLATSEQQSVNTQVTPTKNVKNDNKEIKTKRNGFIKPTPQEVDKFAFDESINLIGYFDYYSSNGWKVGKNPMKDWKAAARGWSKRQSQYTGNKTQEIDFDSRGWSQ